MEDKTVFRMQFGAVFQRFRKEAGVSQERLSEIANVDRAYISDIERGASSPTIEMLFTLSKGIGVSPVEIITECVDQKNTD